MDNEHREYTTEENDKLAADFEATLTAELKRRNIPVTQVEAVNFSDINIDIRFRYDADELPFFNYMGFAGFRRNIPANETLEQCVARLVNRWLVDLKSWHEFKLEETTLMLKRGNNTASYQRTLQTWHDTAVRILAWLKQVQD